MAVDTVDQAIELWEVVKSIESIFRFESAAFEIVGIVKIEW